MRAAGLIALPFLAASYEASAQEVQVARDEVAPSSFSTMDRLDATSRVGTSAGFSFFDDVDGLDFALRSDLFGQYVHESGAAGYLALPITHLAVEGEDESALGNLELGGGYVWSQGKAGVALRGGLLLPTADDDEGVLVNVFSTVAPRLTDVATIAPDSTWLRMSISPLARSGAFFLRADLGLDVPVAHEDTIDPDPFARANVGAGALAGPMAVTAEVVTLIPFADNAEVIHTGAIGARYHAGRVRPGVSLVSPLDDDGRGEIWAALADVSVTID